MFRIMIVEDDETIAGILAEALQRWGCETSLVTDFSTVLEQFIHEEPHLILLDISLPSFNGYYWCSQIRTVSSVPIVFISSNTGNMDIIMAMNMGGDDFITKPFDLNVAVAKVQAVLRRSYSYREEMEVVEHRGLMLNLKEVCFLYKGQRVDLTKNEFRILKVLFEQIGTVVSREELMKRLWDEDCFIDDNTLTVNITRLRKRLEGYGLCGLIETKKGMGYRMTDEEGGKAGC